MVDKFGYFNKVPNADNTNVEDFEEVKLKDDEYYVMGDNRPYSKDSRYVGPVQEITRSCQEDVSLVTNFRYSSERFVANVQWFPGHMTKAKRQMEENLKKVDFVIEIRDARMPVSSKNPMLDQLIQNKPRLILFSKKDKADKELTKQWVNALETENQKVLALDFIHENFSKQLIKASNELCINLIEKQKRRGMKPRALLHGVWIS